jgi:hypothetical protein
MAASFAQPYAGVVESENQEVLVLGWDASYAKESASRSASIDHVTLLTIDEAGHLRLRDMHEVRFRMILDPVTQVWDDDPIPGSGPSA